MTHLSIDRFTRRSKVGSCMVILGFMLCMFSGAHSAFAQGDVWVTGIEITQAIQTYDASNPALSNQIPLIGFKPTVVRVYVQSAEDARGPWSDVTARLTLSDADDTAPYRITRHEHVPSNSSEIVRVSPAGSNRKTLEDSFYFVLDVFDTAPGDRILSVRISSVSGRTETNYGNNLLTTRVHFGPSAHATLYGVTYANTNPAMAAAPWSDFEAHRRFTESVLPLSYLVIVHWPGDPVLSFDDSDPQYRAYQRARDWASQASFRFSAENYGDASIQPQPIYLLQPEDTCLCGGTSFYSDNIRVLNGQNNHWNAGRVMAHEVGHWFGRPHTFSEDHPSEPPYDLRFPYEHAQIGPQVGVDVGVTGLPFSTAPSSAVQLAASSPSEHFHDLMSYGYPIWISPFTYCALMHETTHGALSCPAGADDARRIDQSTFIDPQVSSAHFGLGSIPRSKNLSVPSQNAGQERTLLYVSGRLNLDGTATFNPFEMISTRNDLASKSSGEEYRFSLETADGKTLGEYKFDKPELSDCSLAGDAQTSKDKKPPSVSFNFAIPYDKGTARIVLRKGDKVLAERKVSPSYPEIKMLRLKEGKEALTGRQTVSWQATDSDGDPLAFSIEYSFNGGKTWVPVAVDISQSSVDIDFESLPGSDDALLRVFVSDGVNTSEARLDHTFQVTRKAPQVTVSGPANGRLALPAFVEASAFDWEDGSITDPVQYQWTSNRDGLLGIGPSIFLADSSLSPGEHTIALKVRDSDKNVTTTRFVVTIGAKASRMQKK
jgi:hypothetical protein